MTIGGVNRGASPEAEARQRLAAHGPNALPEAKVDQPLAAATQAIQERAHLYSAVRARP